MKPLPTLARITVFPIKSLDGAEVSSAEISEGGCLRHDREFAITDSIGNPIIGKTNPLVHHLRASVDFDGGRITLADKRTGQDQIFQYPEHIHRMQSFLSDFFNQPVFLHQNKQGRFLDIPDISGATLVSTASLESVSGWFPGLDLAETRKRFRASLEIEGVPAFWEDGLFALPGRAVAYRIGEVTLLGMSPRARCIVPTRHPDTGKPYARFAPTFSKARAENLPAGSRLGEYGNHYYLTVDSLLSAAEVGKFLRVGDPVTVIGEVDAPIPAQPKI